MPRFPRSELMERFRAMAARGEPIIGGGAGTGLSAKCEEAGGIDLIVIYNSGRYRMAGRGSTAGLLAYGNANEIVLEMAREVLPVARRTPVLAGVNGSACSTPSSNISRLSASRASRTSRPSASSTASSAGTSRRRA
jgi:predicted TIM-barrel enzyme